MQKSNKDNKETKSTPLKLRVRPYLVWILRILIGGIFIFSGFAKAVDPWGFILKISEYLNVWGIDWLWRESIVSLAVGIAVIEFCTGVLMATGCLRRAVCWATLIFMCAMLPLTAYIAIESPVSDCGCFGDALVISNNATFAKNIFITIATVYLLFNNYKVGTIFNPMLQWIVIVASIFYSLILAFVGITIQPIMDFRQYRVGTELLSDSSTDVRLIYEKDGVTESFDMDELPDSTWTYVGRETIHEADSKHLAIFDGEDDVTDYVISDDDPQLLLIVPDTKMHQKARASMANNLNEYVSSYGGSMIGVVSADSVSLQEWQDTAQPNFDVYTSEDTSLRELVRGDAGLVYLRDGEIIWKRNIYSLPGDFPDFSDPDNELDKVWVIDSGKPLRLISAIYLSVLLVVFLLSLIRIKKDKNLAEKTK